MSVVTATWRDLTTAVYILLSVTLTVHAAASPLTVVCGQPFSHVRQHCKPKQVYHLHMLFTCILLKCKMQS